LHEWQTSSDTRWVSGMRARRVCAGHTATAASEAGNAFKRGDYAKTVKLLESHLPHLSPSQRKRYELAKKAMEAK